MFISIELFLSLLFYCDLYSS